MFGTSGIRGIYGKEITEELAYKVANIFSKEMLFLGRDIRKSGPCLRDAIVSGATESGCDVVDLDIVPTPTVALATKTRESTGVMITASHNPMEYNGLKLIEHGKEIGKDKEAQIQRDFGKNIKKQNRGCRYADNGIIDLHKDMVRSMIDEELIRSVAPRVIVDCNGAASAITPSLLTDLGCRVISINSSFECFNRPSEPSPENVSYLSGIVRGSADFAVVHDGDGDRCAIIDEKGQMLPLDVQLAIMIEHEMERSRKQRIVSTVEASLMVKEVVESRGGSIAITPVGSTHVAERMECDSADFGGEPCGEYIYGKGVHVPDAVLAAAKFSEIFCVNGKFSELRKKYKEHFMVREKFMCSDNQKSMQRIKDSIDVPGKIRDDDGMRIDEEDGWLLIRPSGTEPLIRLTMEYKTKEKLKKRKSVAVATIKESIA